MKTITMIIKLNILINLIKSNDILITINGSGDQRFVSSYYTDCPDIIYFINGTEIGNNTCHTTFEKEENTILLKWYNHPISGYKLFTDLKNIIQIKFLNITVVRDMHYIFCGCTSLKLIDFTGIHIVSKDKNQDTMFRAFKNCESLTSLDLSPLTSLRRDFREMFHGCKYLEYINFINFNESTQQFGSLSLDNIIPKNLVICINESLSPNFYSSLLNRACTTIYCGENWRKKQKIYIAENNTCMDYPKDIIISDSTFISNEYTTNDINSQSTYISDYLYTIFINDNINNIYNNIYNNIDYINNTIDNINNTIDNIIITNNIINTNNINITNIIRDLIKANNTIEQKMIVEKIINIIEEGGIKNLIITKNETILIQNENEIYQIATLSNQIKDKTIASINFGECENHLKNTYNIDLEEELIIYSF